MSENFRSRNSTPATRTSPWHSTVTFLTLAFVAVAGAACESSNILDGGSTPDPSQAGAPEVVILQDASGDTVPATMSDTARVGRNMTHRVTTWIRDETGIAEVRMVGIAFVGDEELGTDEEIVRFEEVVISFPAEGADTLPTDTFMLRRDLQPVGDSSALVHIIVTATDAAGAVSTDTSLVLVGGPTITFISPDLTASNTTRVGQPIDVIVEATDPLGIENAVLYITGVIADTVDLVEEGSTFSYHIPGSRVTEIGVIRLRVEAWNTAGVAAPTAEITLQVIPNTEPDNDAPRVEFSLAPQPKSFGPFARVEQQDTIEVLVKAVDDGGMGVVRTGIIIDAIVNHGLDTVRIERSRAYTEPAGTAIDTFRIAVAELYGAVGAAVPTPSLPDSIDLRVDAFAFDQPGNSDTVAVATGAQAVRGRILAVAGYTVELDGQGIISDAVVDAPGLRLFLSNFTQSRVDVLSLADSSFVEAVLAGAQPWGMVINNSGDTLLVANSGGTNISRIRLSTLEEDVAGRIYTPNVVLYQTTAALDETGAAVYTLDVFGFSDRPQFVAQAATGEILFSTVPTGSAPDGTIRVATRQPTWAQYEVELLYPGGEPTDESAASSVVIADADSVKLSTTGNVIIVYDHVPGNRSAVRTGSGPDPETAVAQVNAAGGDVQAFRGSFLPESVGMQDTTFVASSGDRTRIAFGEGATAGEGRIVMWTSGEGQSSAIEVMDLIHNAAERVTGLGLNSNGTLGVARGDFAAYYFTPDLRLQGIYAEDINPGGFGAVLHPDHAATAGPDDHTRLSFIGTAESTIKIVDTFHFFAEGEIAIRSPIAGPLRAARPLPGANAGLTGCGGAAPDPECVVVTLYGVVQSEDATQPDGVVIVDVREKDLQQ